MNPRDRRALDASGVGNAGEPPPVSMDLAWLAIAAIAIGFVMLPGKWNR